MSTEVQAGEQVLAIPTAYFNTVIGKPSSGVLVGANVVMDAIRKLFAADQVKLIDRKQADADESYKQLIPYAILSARSEHGLPWVFRYRRSRKGGEDRLHDKLSIGVGGHISTGDWNYWLNSESMDQQQNLRVPYYSAMMREVAEELTFDADTEYHEWPVGIIYDDSNPVGRVHVGIAHVIRVMDSSRVQALGHEIQDAEWREEMRLMDDLKAYENWSQILVRAIRGGRITI